MGSTDKVLRIFINFTTAKNLMQSFYTLSGRYPHSIHANGTDQANLQAGNQILEPIVSIQFIALKVFTFHSARALNLKVLVSV